MTRRAPTFRTTATGVALWVGAWLFGACLLWVAGQVVWGVARAIGGAW